jgi:hypothetical protein
MVGALGAQSVISRPRVRHINGDVVVQMQAFLNKPWRRSIVAYVYIDYTYLNGRLGRISGLKQT